MRLASVGRVMTPRSPGANAFESGWESDEDGTELADEEDILYRHDNANSAADFMIAHVRIAVPSEFMFKIHKCRFLPCYLTFRHTTTNLQQIIELISYK